MSRFWVKVMVKIKNRLRIRIRFGAEVKVIIMFWVDGGQD